MSIIIEAPYVAALKEQYLTRRCSACFKPASNPCPACTVMVYCSETCRISDTVYHKPECESYGVNWQKGTFPESVIVRMIVRVITRLSLDGGEPHTDLCSNVAKEIKRRSWSDLLGHRDEMSRSDRHWKDWLNTKEQLQFLFKDQFNDIDLLEIFGKILINRFRVGIFNNILDGRIAVGWAIYLTTSRFNHCCQPDLLQCSFDINMRLKLSDQHRKLPEKTVEFNQLTVSYRHQNDFRLANPLSYVPTRRQRRNFVSFFFFNCHCHLCDDDLRNRYTESATNRLCTQCGDSLVLQDDFNDSAYSILTCLGRRTCLNTQRVVDRIQLRLVHHNESSIDDCEEILKMAEEILHPQSILLLQQQEKVFFMYQQLLREDKLSEYERKIFVNRAIQLGEQLIRSYDFHLPQSPIYPKILLTDVAQLCSTADNNDRATELYEKALNLWRQDYQGYINDEPLFLGKLNFVTANKSNLLS